MKLRYKNKHRNKCNAFIEELCDKFDKEELNLKCQICGVKIAFHKRKIRKQKKHIKRITNNYTTNINYINSNLLNQNNSVSLKLNGDKGVLTQNFLYRVVRN
jgi:hypothetical protein